MTNLEELPENCAAMRHTDYIKALPNLPKPESIEFLKTATIPALLEQITQRDIVIMHSLVPRCENAANTLEEILITYGLTVRKLSRNLMGPNSAILGTARFLKEILEGEDITQETFVIFLTHEPPLQKLLRDSSVSIGYCEVIAANFRIPGHK